MGGCTTLSREFESISYPPDKAILIGDVAYQINAEKCAEIKNISEDGTLDCYDMEGKQSASISPTSEWRRNIIEERFKWASPEHQAFLFYLFHEGGAQKVVASAVNSAQQAYGSAAAIKSLADSSRASREMTIEGAKMSMKGTQAYMTGGMTAWQAHQSTLVQWHLNNAKYFSDKLSK